MKWTPRRLKLVLNLYPPYVFAGVKIERVDPEWREIRVSMKLRWFNKNAVGTHFGGSLYSMVDPHLVLLLMQRLGPKYTVWDRAAAIRYRKPGRGRVRSTVRISDDDVETIRRETAGGETYRPTYELSILDEAGDTVATVTKELHVGRRHPA